MHSELAKLLDLLLVQDFGDSRIDVLLDLVELLTLVRREIQRGLKLSRHDFARSRLHSERHVAASSVLGRLLSQTTGALTTRPASPRPASLTTFSARTSGAAADSTWATGTTTSSAAGTATSRPAASAGLRQHFGFLVEEGDQFDFRHDVVVVRVGLVEQRMKSCVCDFIFAQLVVAILIERQQPTHERRRIARRFWLATRSLRSGRRLRERGRQSDKPGKQSHTKNKSHEETFSVGWSRGSQVAIVRCPAQDDVEVSGELADFGILERLEISEDQFAVDQVANAVVNAVGSIARMSAHEQLCREQFVIALQHLHMNVRSRPTGIRHRLDCAEAELARLAGREVAEALKVLVLLTRLRPAVGRVQVHRVRVALPNFDRRIANRLPLGVENAPRQMRDLADRRSDRVVDDQQIVVFVERQLVGIKRPLGERRLKTRTSLMESLDSDRTGSLLKSSWIAMSSCSNSRNQGTRETCPTTRLFK